MGPIATVVLLVFHGLVHILGVTRPPASWSGRALVPLWFVAGALFCGAAVLSIVSSAWPFVALTGVFVSQALVLTRWREAKGGTLMNAVIFVIAVVAVMDR